MSINYDLYNKSTGKKPCPPGTARVKRCSLNLNPHSEDILSSNVFGHLKLLQPTLWVQKLLTRAYGERDFTHLDYSTFGIRFWDKAGTHPLKTGRPEFDFSLDVSPIKVITECKYRSCIRMEQLVQYLNLIAHLHYETLCQDVYFLLITTDESEPEVLSQFRDADILAKHIEQMRPHTDYKRLCINLSQNIGWISWAGILQIIETILAADLHYSERQIINDLVCYLRYKLNSRTNDK